jgi:hypothetical protein
MTCITRRYPFEAKSKCLAPVVLCPEGACMCLASVIRPEGTAPKGQESLAQGLPWVSRNKRFALKGLEMCRRSSPEVRSRFPPYLLAPSGLIPVGELTQGKPWAMLFWPLRAKDWKPPNPRDLRRNDRR